MKKLYIYLDETYNLQNKNQFYSFGGFVTSDSEHIKLEYKRLLKGLGLLSKKANKEVKSTDKDALKIREKLFNSGVSPPNRSKTLIRNFSPVQELGIKDFLAVFS